MRKSLFTVAALAAAVLAARAQAATTITIGNATGDAGTSVAVDVTLATDVEVAGTQNDLSPAAGTSVVVKPGKCSTTKTTACVIDADCPEGETCKGFAPDCTVNPDIDKTGTAFAFQPPSCQGSACTGIRALVLSLSNTDPIPTGSVLYTCNVAIAADTAGGDYALTASGVQASDPSGGVVPATGVNGTITVNGVAPTTPVVIQVGSTSGAIGEAGLSIDVSLQINDDAVEVAGTQNDITFSGGIGAPIEIAAKAGKCSTTKTTSCFVDGDCPEGETCKGVAPDCTVNPDIDKTGTAFAFQPSGCQGELCTGVRALVLSLSNTDPIPDGSVLYSCVININDTAADQSYPLTCSGAQSSDPAGGSLETSCTNGAVTVGGGGATPTPTDTVEPTPTDTPGVTATATATGTNTAVPTVTKKPTNTPGGGGGNDDDGCAVTAPANSGSGWMLLLPAAALLWIRRRTK